MSTGASQPATRAAPLDLKVLNKSSAKLGTFIVRIAHGRVVDYNFKQKGTDKPVVGHKFEACLVGVTAENYCIGFVRGSVPACKAAAQKFTDGSCWLLSKVSLDNYTASAYTSTPVAVRIDLDKSTLQHTAEDSGVPPPAVHPVPPRTVADAGRIWTNKCTDLLAMVKSVSRDRTSKSGDAIADVVLGDDSKVDGDVLGSDYSGRL